MPLQRRALGGGLEPAVVTKTSEVVSLLSNDTDINNRITVTGGSTTEIAQTGSTQLTGGGLGFTIGSTVTDVVAAINNHSTAGGLITASGSGSTLLSPCPGASFEEASPPSSARPVTSWLC